MPLTESTKDAEREPAAALLDMQAAIDRYCESCERGEWTPSLDEQLWRDVLGNEAQPFPFESVPPERELRVRCAEHQYDHRTLPIALPLVVSELPDDAAKRRLLKDAVRWMAKQRGHDLCWEHAHMLASVVAHSRGEVANIPRPPHLECMLRCNLFAGRLYAALTASQNTLTNREG